MMTPSRDISRLLEIMAMLRTPGTGCPVGQLIYILRLNPAQRKATRRRLFGDT
jgi:hypothetical protein